MKNIIYIFTFGLLLISCHSESNNLKDIVEELPSYEVEDAGFKYTQTNKDKVEIVQRKLIKRGNVSFEVDDLVLTTTNIKTSVKKFNGYIAEEKSEKGYYSNDVTITVRIPNTNFDAFLGEISQGVKEFDEKNISVSDVTEEFLDVSARIKTKKELENRYLQLLAKAKNVKEILEVEKELEQVRSDIERAEGRLKYLENNVTFSTLRIKFYKKIEQKIEEDSFWGKIIKAFTNGFDGLQSLFLFLITIWPLLIIAVVIYIFVRKKLKNNTTS
ncbi:DUF4349 domain-containing protein [Tenacibaculum sp. MEBiC06402]|uniref:DUF4349 domain-containing protein n=1 Tax=unclassified Tenacibaculum TaxID=2635139 RepID=UPI003B9BAAE6